ncbi:BatE [Formosa agariphila KMM 3901]|uniref:BatE n=1 Tax=Formosa agariphila (strain DSM 15362 / KCTC 12365 / LMG 23005 / KMM 3901 / M-2Alg 35-1) TaxID=1347342 RepID=T2KRE4_FORAG|nr:tetratricopeptide repeat protein [Formosa agariphila]CDF81093.1 BatE [Formosa agariphila KMM 3901]
MKAVLYILMILLSNFTFAQEQSLFEQGNTLYNEGKYAEAIDKYQAILDSNMQSSEVFFNLGNAHYKLNHVGPSIYYFEKALQLAPRDKEIKNNIAYARNMTIDAIDVVPEVGISKLLKNITNVMSFDGWAITTVILFILFVVLFISYYFAEYTNKKRAAFSSSIIILIVGCFTLFFAFHNYNQHKKDNPAIIFAQESQVKNEPNLSSPEAFKLHEGTKVQVLDTVNNWKKIKLSDGKTGWISSADIKVL